MKKCLLIVSLALIALCFTQCKKEIPTELTGNALTPNGTFTLTANIDNGGSKTGITAGGVVSWATGDKIYVVHPTDGVVGYLDYGNDNNFSGNLSLADGVKYNFYYLGSIDRTLNTGDYTITISDFAEQAGTLSDITQKHHLMMGTATVSGSSASATMTSMISIAYFDISGFTSQTVKVYGANIYKGMNLNLTGGTITPTDPASGNSTAITIGGTNAIGAYVAFVPTNQATLTFENPSNASENKTLDGQFKFTANSFYTANANNNPIIVKQKTVPTGAVKGLFSVGPGTRVRFSQGNLQYIGNATTPYWKFADNQYDFIGAAQDGSTASNINRDLFGWGTSGLNSGNTYYHPYDTDKNQVYKGQYPWYGENYGPSGNNDLTGNWDWGYNTIYNGGNTTNLWRTLTNNELSHLLFNRRYNNNGTSYHLVGSGTLTTDVNGNAISLLGCFIMPDNYESKFTKNYEWTMTYTDLTTAGGVFLPAAGIRNGTEVSFVGNQGYYWSSSYCEYKYPYDEDLSYPLAYSLNLFYVNYNDIQIDDEFCFRSCGFSVRLVQNY